LKIEKKATRNVFSGAQEYFLSLSHWSFGNINKQA